MPDTYTQLYVQIVFAVKYRRNFIAHHWKFLLYKYITRVVQTDNHTMLAIGGMADHIHIFLGINPAVAVSEIVKDIKRASNNWINKNKFIAGNFQWQGGYAAFSYRKGDIKQICTYIHNQEQHHGKVSFKQEYTDLLSALEIELKPEYLFEFYDE